VNFPRSHAGLFLLAASAVAQSPAPRYNPADGQKFLRTNCAACHAGKALAGGFDIARLALPASFRERSEAWSKAALRVHNG
jgi:mono/diheme cytochrome c family protein